MADEASAAAASAHDEAVAQRDVALDSLAELVAIFRGIGGYLKPEQQDSLRHARAVLAAAGRAVP